MAAAHKEDRGTWQQQYAHAAECHAGSKETAAPKEETPNPVAAVKENLPSLDAAKPGDNPLAGPLDSRELPLLGQTYLPWLPRAMPQLPDTLHAVSHIALA